MREPVFDRKCDGCTACCKTHSVSEVDSVAGVWCQYCRVGEGCAIYEERPLACRTYSCVWLQGKGDEGGRPDRLKIVMDYFGIEFGGEKIPIFNFWEVEEGVIEQPLVQKIMLANIKVGNIVVGRPLNEPPTYYFPKGMFSTVEQQSFVEIAEHGSKNFLRRLQDLWKGIAYEKRENNRT